MRSDIPRGSFVPGPSPSVPPPGVGLCWQREDSLLRGGGCLLSHGSQWYCGLLFPRYSVCPTVSILKVGTGISQCVSCVPPLSFLTVVAFLIWGQLLGPYVVCHPARLTFPGGAKCLLGHGFVLKSPFLLSVEPRAPCRVGTTTEVPMPRPPFFSWDWVRSVA